MSIVALKKKVQSQYDNMSVNSKNGFSLNGTRRNQGYVGQTMLSRSLPRTTCKGNVPKGWGGCCGKYAIKPIIQSGVNYLNNPNVVKSSVVSTKGMLEKQNICVPPTRCILNNINDVNRNVVKPDSNNHNNNQQNYIDRLKNKTIVCSTTKDKKIDDSAFCLKRIKFYPNTNYNFHPFVLVTDPTKTKNVSQSDYITNLKNTCVNNDIVYVTTNTKGTPFSCSNVK